MTKTRQLEEALKGAIITTRAAAPQPATQEKPETPTKTKKAKKTTPPRGKNVHFFLHDEDKRLIRELSAWLAGQGVRTSDSMVIRASLRAVKTGREFMEAYQQASLLDGRFKREA